MTRIHPLLRRQLEQHLGQTVSLVLPPSFELEQTPPEWQNVLRAVNATYAQFDPPANGAEGKAGSPALEPGAGVRAVFERLVQSSVDGIFAFDCEYVLTAWNPTMERLYGVSRAAALGRAIGELYPEWVRVGDQAYCARAIAGHTVIAPVRPFVEASGAEGEAREYFETQYGPLRDESGVIIGGLAILRNITELRQTADELRASQARYRELYQNAVALGESATALNRTLDLETVLDQILLNAAGIVPYDTASILLLENGHVRVARARDPGHLARDRRLQGRTLDLASTPNLRRMAESGQPVIVDETSEGSWVRLPDEDWVRSELGVPLLTQERLLGFLSLDSTVPGFYTPAHAERLQQYAHQATFALENARLWAETRRRLAELEAVNRVSLAMRAAQSPEEMLPRLIDETLAALDLSAAAIYLFDPLSGLLEPAATRGWVRLTGPIDARAGLEERVIATGQVYVSHEWNQDPALSPVLRAQIPAGWGGACVPIRAAQDTIGLFFVSARLPREIQPNEVRVLTILAELVGSSIHRLQLYAQTEKRLSRLDSLRTIDLSLTASLDWRLTLTVLLDQLTKILRVDAADVLLYSRERQLLEYAVGHGFRGNANTRTRVRLGEEYAGLIALERRAIGVTAFSGAKNPQRGALLSGEGFRSYYGVPLVAKGEIKGVLELFHRSELPADPEWMDFCEMVAGQAALAIDNAELFENLQRSNFELALAYDSTLEGWSRALDLRDRETEGHTQRVTEMTLRLAEAHEITRSNLAHIRRGALLHDIGKMGIPDRILLKPGPLDVEEWEIMRRHPDYANEMLSPISFLRPALDIPYCHHERWDGGGYPRGLRGESIPLAARIFAIVDVWDALRSDRRYRAAWDENQVRAYLQEQAGRHFDPAVVRRFLELHARP